MSRAARVEKVAEALRAHLPDSAYSSGCRLACGYDGDNLDVHLAAAVLAALDADAQETTAGRANDCTHGSATGVNTSDGPDKVWACDHCGLQWRQDGASLDDAQAKVERCEALPAQWGRERSKYRGAPGTLSPIDAGIRAALRGCAEDLRAALNPEPTS